MLREMRKTDQDWDGVLRPDQIETFLQKFNESLQGALDHLQHRFADTKNLKAWPITKISYPSILGVSEKALAIMLREMRKTDRDQDGVLRPYQIETFLEKFDIIEKFKTMTN